jgi:hypothetical protein
MPSRPHRHLHGLRLLALVVFALALLVKPVLAASCELQDMRLAQGDGRAMAVDAVAGQGEGECCPGQLCGDCCTAGTVVPMAATPALSMPLAARPPVAIAAGFDPTPQRVATRPPIAA